MIININTKIHNIKFPKVIFYNNCWYIYGINSVIDKIMNLNKFYLECFKYDENFNFIKKLDIKYNFKRSTLIWQIIDENDYFVFLIEQKSIDKIKHSCKYYKYYIKKKELEVFKILKIEKIPLENHLISKIYNNFILSSKIEVDEQRPEYYWGKYLFLFIKDNVSYIPKFDKIVDYSKDKGHLLHYIEKRGDEYFIIFSIRHKYVNKNEYYYNIYSAKSFDLISFKETKKIEIENNLTNSNWYCYPEILKIKNKYIILLNQDDFGKNKKTLIGKLIL